jgi:uncharacterized protein YwgA
MGEVERLSDNSILYSMKEFEKKLSKCKKEEKRVLVTDAIYILLYSHHNKPIYGRTMLMKQVFLLFEEIFKNEKISYQNPNFVPYNFGPYSFTVMEIIENLKNSGELVVQGRKNTKKEKFELSEKALEKAKHRFSTVSPKLKKLIKEKRIGWDQLGNDGMLRYVYLNYPDYKEKSIIKNRYSDIHWGIGKA